MRRPWQKNCALTLGNSLDTSRPIYALIPARSGSQSIKHKNISKIHGHPLLAYSIAAARLCPEIDRVFVSTDSKIYSKVAEDYGAECPFLRPKEFAEDNSTDLEFFKHFIDWCRAASLKVPSAIVHLRPTTATKYPHTT